MAKRMLPSETPDFCTISSCGRTHWAKGYCKTHWQRSRNGSPPMDAPINDKRRGTPDERFDRKWVQDPESDCLHWTGYLINGYGKFRLRKGFQVSAHTFAYERMFGPVPEDLVLDHTCHPIDGTCPGGEACRHRRCVNPLHLKPISRGDNSRRCVPVHLRYAA